MPYYIEGQFYYTQAELQRILDRLLETCWMYAYSQTEEQKQFLRESITFNFRMDHPEFGTRTQADDEAMKARYEALMAEEDTKRQAEKAIIAVTERESHMARLREKVAHGYHPAFYEKLSHFIERSKTGKYGDFTKIGENTLYCNPNSFTDYLYESHELPRLTQGDIISISDGGLQPILVVLRYTPILSLYNMDRHLENTKDEYIYGTVLEAPEGVPYPHGSRIILQTKNIRRIEGKVRLSNPVQPDEICGIDIA